MFILLHRRQRHEQGERSRSEHLFRAAPSQAAAAPAQAKGSPTRRRRGPCRRAAEEEEAPRLKSFKTAVVVIFPNL